MPINDPLKCLMESSWNLPEETTFDILSRLPAKSVGLCRCVSKPWRALLTRPDFIRTHLHISTTSGQQSLTFFGTHCRLVFASLRDAHHLFDKITLSTQLSFQNYRWGDVYASCHGLVLARDGNLSTFVLNPITREIRKVPLELILDNGYGSFYNIRYGIGFDSINDDYKVVVLSYYNHCRLDLNDGDDEIDFNPNRVKMFIDVYSLKSGCWKMVGCSPVDHSPYDSNDSGVYVGGSIHWLIHNVKDNKHTIMGFDLGDNNHFYEMSLPCLIETGIIPSAHLAVLDGCLCLFHVTEKYVWVMKEYGVQESWTMFTISNLPRVEEIRILGSLGQGEVLLWTKCPEETKLVMYNVKEGISKDVVV